jgi:hypothetical protein
MIVPRRKRRVRIHYLRDSAPSIEGVFKGFWAGHYIIAVPQIVNGSDPIRFEGPSVRIHKSQVSLMEDLL